MSIDPGQPYLSPPPPAGAGYPIGQPPPALRRRRSGVVAVVAGVVGVGVLAGGGYLAYGVLGGAGDRADVALPGTAAAAVTLDLDPSVSQKLGAIQFAHKFPEGRDLDWNSADRDPRKWIYERLTKGSGTAPGWSEVEPWLGKRAGLAVLPDGSDASGERPAVVFALQVTDSGAARASLAKLTDADRKPVGVAGEGEWVLVGESQAYADAAWSAAKASPLSDSATYRADVDALGGEGLANIWVDSTRLAAIGGAMPMGGSLLGGATSQAGGHGAMTLRFDGPNLELAGAFREVKPSAMAFAGATAADTALPADAIGVLSLGGLGEQVAASWPDVQKQLADLGTGDAAQLEQQTGLTLPADLKALLGTQFALVVSGDGDTRSAGVRVRSDDPELTGALDRLSAFVQRDLGQSVTPTPIDGGYLLGLGGEVPAGLADGGTLGSTPAFTRAVPEADGAAMIGYIDIGKAAAAFPGGMSATDRGTLAALQSLGFSARRDGDAGSRFVLRLTTKD